MNKNVVNELIKFGLITNIDIDASKYADVDDLITKGVVTIPGAKAKIEEIIASLNIGDDQVIVETTNEDIVNVEPVIDEAPVTDPVIDETPEVEPVIDEAPVTDPVIDETPVEDTNTVEIIEETTNEVIAEVLPNEENIVETKTEVKKTTKKIKKTE